MHNTANSSIPRGHQTEHSNATNIVMLTCTSFNKESSAARKKYPIDQRKVLEISTGTQSLPAL